MRFGWAAGSTHGEPTRIRARWTVEIRPPLLLCGPPAVGKSVTGRVLALSRPRCALIDVDDVRQLVLSGAAAPWEGEEGRRQQSLGVLNACAIAGNFIEAAVEVIVVDVATPDTMALYREHLPECVVVRLTVSLTEALRRAAGRRVWLTNEEFRLLHEADAAHPPQADHTLDVGALDPAAQADAVERVWVGRRHRTQFPKSN